jgi:hypothetical protein
VTGTTTGALNPSLTRLARVSKNRRLMRSAALKRRRSDVPEFIQTGVDIDVLAEEIFSRYEGEQDIVVEGQPYRAAYFRQEYCPDFRVMKLAGQLALAVNRRAVATRGGTDAVEPLRVTIQEIMLAALLHDLGKQHEDCAPFIDLLRETDLRDAAGPDANRRKQYLLDIVRDAHCRKGPCMIDRLRDAGRPELNNPFIATVARRHGDDYQVNQSPHRGVWWAREINTVTIADDYDAITSEGPERAYKPRNTGIAEAAAFLRGGVARGRYEPVITDIFLTDVLRLQPVG